jgi:putative nucleotidyltransferase with HDIG domain
MLLEELFGHGARVPSLPEVFYRFKKAANDPDTSFEEMGQIISCDIGLTAHLLRIVNSPFYGFSSQVETVPHAISILGRDQLGYLVLSTCILKEFKNIPQKVLDMELFWEHNFACGLASKIIATHLGIGNPDSIFVSGLLHDIGRLLISINIPEKFTEIFLMAQMNAEHLLDAELKILGFGHDEAGAELLRRWKIPKIHEESVRFHHSPAKAPFFAKEASIICIANSLVNSLVLGSSGDLLDSEIEREPLEVLGINEKEAFSLFSKEIQEQYQGAIDIFL